MKKQILIVGIIVLLVAVGLSGCNEQKPIINMEDDSAKLIGTWELEINGTSVAYTNWTFYSNGSLKTIRVETYKMPPSQTISWMNYSITNSQLCTEYEEYGTNYTYEFSENGNKLELRNYSILIFYKEEYNGPKPWSSYMIYWENASNWLSEQNKEISENQKKPSFMSWLTSSMSVSLFGDHPNIGTDLNDEIPPTGNFFLATSEKEAVSIWIAHLLISSEKNYDYVLSNKIFGLVSSHLGVIATINIRMWIQNPSSAPSYATIIGYDPNLDIYHLVDEKNALYKDISNIIVSSLDDNGVTWFYHDLQNLTGLSIRYFGVEGYDKTTFTVISYYVDKSPLLYTGGEDNFMILMYQGYKVDEFGYKIFGSEQEWTIDEINNMSEIERNSIRITGTSYIYKDDYFETMFYKTYIGPYQLDQTSGSKQEYDWQVPCYDMKHFYADYMSDMAVYPYYDTGKAAVVIAKYYEGAYVNGTVSFRGEPVYAEINVLKNLTYSSYRNVSFPIEHDRMTMTDGTFNLIAGAGAWLQIRRNFGQYIAPFAMKNVTFDGEEGSETAPISDDDAMRKGTNYDRVLDITIQPATIQGYVYADNDGDSSFNYSVDKPLKNVNISLYELISESQAQLVDTVGFDGNGSFNASELLPSYYFVRAEKNGFVLNETLISLYENENYYNFSEMKHSSINGKVYYNDENDVVSDANVELVYKRMDINGQNVEEEILANTTTTDSNGRYAFTNLIPGEYELTVTKGDLYRSFVQISLGENETLSQNVSIG